VIGGGSPKSPPKHADAWVKEALESELSTKQQLAEGRREGALNFTPATGAAMSPAAPSLLMTIPSPSAGSRPGPISRPAFGPVKLAPQKFELRCTVLFDIRQLTSKVEDTSVANERS
jgi:hypothetical protein